MEIDVGNVVRSFDFPYRRDLHGEHACYMEGEVTDIVEHPHFGYKCYEIQVTRTVFGGKEYNDGPLTIYPPVNGTYKALGGVTDGVEVVSESR